mgnify:CR=1 FL=1
MRCYRLSIDQKIKLPVDKVFDFFSQPENLEKITPSEIGFQIITPTPIEMKKNLIIDYKIKICGFPVSWKTCIINYKPPIFFSDIQIKGPYSMWEHTHIFKECKNGTMMIDKIKCERVLRYWSIPLKGSAKGMSADRNVFHALRNQFRHQATGRPTCYYAMDPKDGLHSKRINWIRKFTENVSQHS